LPLDGLPASRPRGERDGFYQGQLIRELAVRHVTSWTGVQLEGGPAPPTPENIAAVMELYPVGERFFQEFTLRQVLLNAAKALCDVEADDGKGCHGRLPRSWWVQRSHAGTSMPSAGGVHVIIRALCRWHFQPSRGPEYCRTAATTVSPAPEASVEQTGGSARIASTP
jgi:hypothetical protein